MAENRNRIRLVRRQPLRRAPLQPQVLQEDFHRLALRHRVQVRGRIVVRDLADGLGVILIPPLLPIA